MQKLGTYQENPFHALALSRASRNADYWLCNLGEKWSVLGVPGKRLFWKDLEKTSLKVPIECSAPQDFPFGSKLISGFYGYDRSAIFFEMDTYFILDRSCGDLFASNKEAEDLWTFLKLEQKPIQHLPGFPLCPLSSDDEYENLVGRVQEDIRNGRYYQLNLLRYFTIPGEVEASQLLQRFFRLEPKYGSLLQTEALSLYSFSPERFIAIRPKSEGGSLKIKTFPVKGTIAQNQEKMGDENNALQLLQSRKDLSELHMIVDLMRNDLLRVSRPRSVTVNEAHSLMDCHGLHHLFAEIEGELLDGISIASLCENLCPAGSITGAPKVEVMRAIDEYEGRNRGFFMGNSFVFAPDAGYCESSVLIRTLVREQEKGYVYAAGSGIVLHSLAKQERDEIANKTRVLTDDL